MKSDKNMYRTLEPEPIMVREDVAIMEKIKIITNNGNNAEVKRDRQGNLQVLEVRKTKR